MLFVGFVICKNCGFTEGQENIINSFIHTVPILIKNEKKKNTLFLSWSFLEFSLLQNCKMFTLFF